MKINDYTLEELIELEKSCYAMTFFAKTGRLMKYTSVPYRDKDGKPTRIHDIKYFHDGKYRIVYSNVGVYFIPYGVSLFDNNY